MDSTITRAQATAPDAPPQPLDLDQRLALAALAVDARIATTPLDLDDVITGPVALPAAPVRPYPTPAAALLQRAAQQLASGGWCRGATVDEGGARCLYGAVRAADPGGAHTDTAMVVLLDAIRRRFPTAETVPSANDELLPNGWAAARILGEAADLADARGL
ncbi:DUF6197 family protein [Streptomyces mangrovi]|uniref:DUF6197 family protein n=1 Tax=Streptomyces mangrovi TaxID=1206892 RepID=UPI00399D1B1E